MILVDFGAIARISDRMQVGITNFAEGLIKRDTRVIANALRQMGFVAKEDEGEAFDKLVDYFYTKLSTMKIENFKELDVSQLHNLEDLIELKKLNISFRDLMSSFHVPRDWVLLERTLLLALGLTTHLDPKLNPIETVLPYVEKFVLKDKSLTDAIMQMTKEAGISYLRLPYEIHQALQELRRGQIEVGNKDIRQQTRRMYILGHQFIYALLALSGLGLGHWWYVQDYFDMADYHYAGGALFGLILFMSLMKNRKP